MGRVKEQPGASDFGSRIHNSVSQLRRWIEMGPEIRGELAGNEIEEAVDIRRGLIYPGGRPLSGNGADACRDPQAFPWFLL